MKNLLTVVQTLAVSTLVAILVASATVYILSPRISEQIDSVERKAVTQYQKVTDSFQEIDNALSERIDYSLQFGYATKVQIKSMFKKFFPEKSSKEFDEFWLKIKRTKLTMSMLQGYLYRCYHTKDVMKNMDKFLKQSLETKYEDTFHAKMYC